MGKIIQIIDIDGYLTALDDKGNIWQRVQDILTESKSFKWGWVAIELNIEEK